MARRPKNYDWEAIERDYRTGRYTLSQLSSMHGPAKQTISRRASDEGWVKDLTGEVTRRTREKLARPDSAPPDMPEAEAVEKAAEGVASVVRGHRSALAKWRSIAERFTDRLEEQLDAGSMRVMTKSGDVAEVDLPLDYIAKSMASGSQAVERVIRLERQSFCLDDAPGEESPEAQLSDDQLRARIAELEAKRKGQA